VTRTCRAGGVCACAAILLVAAALAHAETEAVGALRTPAEELANKAARRFAQALQRPQEAHTAEHAAEGSSDALQQWLMLSDRAYRALIKRLAHGTEKTAPAMRMPLTGEDAAAAAHFWWRRSRGLFDAMVRRLAEGAAPPPEGVQTRRVAPSPPVVEQGTGPPANAAAAATARMPRPEPAASGSGARDAEKGSAGADHALAPPARVTLPAAPRQPTTAPEVLAAGGGVQSHTSMGAVPMRAEVQGALRKRLQRRRWQPTAQGSGRKPAAIAAKQHRALQRVAAHRANRCATAGRRVALRGWYVVARGDTLWRIARRHYGAGRRYVQIAAANRHRLGGRDRIVPCQRLYLPRASRRR
jgi:colicin import membrane protein